MKRRPRPSKRARRNRSAWTVIPQPRVELNPALAWYVVRTRPRQERRARRELRQLGLSIWLPVLRERGPERRGRPRERSVAYFCGYAFVGVPAGAEDFGAICGADGVADVLRVAHEPRRVPVGLLQAIADRLAGQEAERAEGEADPDAPSFDLGQVVRIEDGPFASLMAHVVGLLSGGRVEVEVEIFGRRSSVNVDASQLEAVV